MIDRRADFLKIEETIPNLYGLKELGLLPNEQADTSITALHKQFTK